MPQDARGHVHAAHGRAEQAAAERPAERLTGRFRAGDDAAEAEESLAQLEERGLTVLLPKEAGKRERRYQQLLAESAHPAPARHEAPAVFSEPAHEASAPSTSGDSAELREEIESLREELECLRNEFRELRDRIDPLL